MMGHVISHAVDRAGVEGKEIDDVVIGSVLTAGTAGMNVARLASLAAGLPTSVPAQTIDRQCSSGLMAIGTAAKQIMVDGHDIAVAGGQENISAVQNEYFKWALDEKDENAEAHAEHVYMPMLQTAEHVANTYGISREAQDDQELSREQAAMRVKAAEDNTAAAAGISTVATWCWQVDFVSLDVACCSTLTIIHFFHRRPKSQTQNFINNYYFLKIKKKNQ